MEKRGWASRTFSLRRTKTENNFGSKKLKGRKIRSSSDVRELRDDVVGPAGDISVPPSPGTPPSSPPVAPAPTSRRKKIWNSFRSRTRRLRGKSRDKEMSFCDSSADVGSGTTDEEQSIISNNPSESGHTSTRTSSFKARWRSNTMRTVSVSDSPVAIDTTGNLEDAEDLAAGVTFSLEGSGYEGLGTGAEEGSGLEDEVDSGITLVESSSPQPGDNGRRARESPLASDTASQGKPPDADTNPSPPAVYPSVSHQVLGEEEAEAFFSKAPSFGSSAELPTTVQQEQGKGSAEAKVFKELKEARSTFKEARSSFKGKLKDSGEVQWSLWAAAKDHILQQTTVEKPDENYVDLDDFETQKAMQDIVHDTELSMSSLDTASLWEGQSDSGIPSFDSEMEESLFDFPISEPGSPRPELEQEQEQEQEEKEKPEQERKQKQDQEQAVTPLPTKEAKKAERLVSTFRHLKESLKQWKNKQKMRSWPKLTEIERPKLRTARRVLSKVKNKIERVKRSEKVRKGARYWRALRTVRIIRAQPHRYMPFEISIRKDSTSSSTIRRDFSSVYRLTSSSVIDILDGGGGYEQISWGDEDSHYDDRGSLNTMDLSGFFFSQPVEVDVSQSMEDVGGSVHKVELLQAPAGTDDMDEEAVLRQRQHALMEHPFFLLDVRLQEGKDLVVRDSCGTSDPYVKFKVGGKQVYKSRTIHKNLNPRWEENFTIPVEDVQKPVQLKVFDYDRGLHDDPMGSAEIDLTQLEMGKDTDLKLLLSDRGKPDYMGYILLSCTLLPKTQEDKEQYLQHRSIRSTEATSTGKKLKMQTWSGVVTIVLVEGFDLVPMDDNGLSDPYVKFRLGSEKHRSKHKSKTLNPRWLEQFDLRMYNEQVSQLEITVYDYDVRGRDDFMGRATIDLSNLESELTHHLDVELEDGAGLLKLLLTISGTCTTDALSDLSNFTPDSRQLGQLQRKYSFLKLSNMTDVGHLQVKVFKASGLKSADIGGNSDPFCVLELVNARVQTHTEYKTLNPEWNKVFSLKVRDIHSVLEVTIFDEDRDKKVEFLGKVAIPLLKIRSGERRWYALKDKKLNHRTKGAILLELDLIFNHVKAALRTVQPAEEKFMQVEPKFKIQLMKKNIDRVSQLISVFMEGGKFLQSCFSWESTPRSATAFVVFLVMVWNFEIYMLPITLLLIFLKNLIIAQIVGAFKREQVEDDYVIEEDEDEDEEKEKNAKAKEEKKTFKEKLQSIQDVCLQVQQGMDMVASLGERIKNTFNWTVPWLSALAVVALSSGVIVLYFIPLRWLILAWGTKKFVKKGINKFTKKLRKPNATSNNELLDFLSRVPSDREVAQYREFRPEFSPATGKKKRS